MPLGVDYDAEDISALIRYRIYPGEQEIRIKGGVEQLSDTRYAKCLKKLTENDKNRLEGLKDDKRYTDIVSYMEKNDCKLEQEIVSLSE